jgi:hypothetical protein
MNSPLSSDSAHWDAVYQKHGNAAGLPAGVSWYRPHLERSLHWIEQLTAGDTAARIIDVGTGESTLADDLLARGYRALTLLDLSATRFGAPAQSACGAIWRRCLRRLSWWAGDVTQLALPESGFDVWHDRAVLHFLTDPPSAPPMWPRPCVACAPAATSSLPPLPPDGPPRCSQRDVMRYSEAELAALFAPGFEAVASEREIHTTPTGTQQAFQILIARRR